MKYGSFIATDRGCSHTVITYLTVQLDMSDGFAAALALIGWFPRTTVSPTSASVNRCRVYRLSLANASTHG